MWVVLALACAVAEPEAPLQPEPTVSSDSAVDTAAPTSDSADSAPDTDVCSDAQLVTYASFGQGFMIESCQGCHASTAPERYGAPLDVTFDTVEQVWERADRVLAMATGEDPAMPPLGGVSDEDRTRLLWWLACAPPGT